MDVENSTLTEQQYAEMKLGLSALWALAVKNRACLERLLSFNREINAYLSLKIWCNWIDFQALIAKYEPALEEANLFLQELDEVVERNDSLQAELITYGQQLVLEMKSHTVKPLVAKFHKLAETTRKQVEEAQAARVLAQIEAENAQLQRNKASVAGYVAHGDGTVSDTTSRLMWMQCAEGQEGLHCEGQVLQYPWEMAMRLPDHLNLRGGFAGYSDWRLPSLHELQSLVRTDERPAICNEAFPNAPSVLFWSSTLVKEGGREACNVYFGSGSHGTNDRDNAYSVRLVRTILPISSCDIDL
jgi:Protein of unknown function (DUF1566)